MDIVYTGIPAFILALIAGMVIALKSVKAMLEEKHQLFKRLKKIEMELDGIKEGMPEKQKRVTKLKLSHATAKDKSTRYMRYYQKVRSLDIEAEKEGMEDEVVEDPKDIQIHKRD